MKAGRVVSVLALLVGMQMPVLVRAQTSQVASRAAITNPTTLNWIGLFGAIDPLLNPALVPGSSGPLAVSATAPVANGVVGGSVKVYQQSCGATVPFWGGVFVPGATCAQGEPVLYAAGGSLTLTFSADIYAIGANVQSSNFGLFSGRITAYDRNGVVVGTATGAGSYIGNENGIAPFLGIQSESGIRSVMFQVTGPIDPQTQLPTVALGINEATIAIARATVPEPGTYALTVAGLAGVLLLARRRRRLSA